MTYSYSNQMPANYGPQQAQFQYNEMRYQKPSAMPYAITGAVLGGAAGAGIGAYKSNQNSSFVSKTGEIADNFAKNVFEKYIKKAGGEAQKSYQGNLNILNKINNIKTPEELKALFEANKEASDLFFKDLNQTSDDFIKKVTPQNLAENKKTISDNITAKNKTLYQDMKNQIQACWNKDKKKFVKSENVSDDVFKIIKKSTGGVNWKTIGKYAGIGALATAIIAYFAGLLTTK